MISVAHLPADKYVLMVFDGKNWFKDKFIKQ
jgi:hypothetical protein